MRWALFAGFVILTACNTTTTSKTPEPATSGAEPIPVVVKTRSMTFSAENSGSPIAAKCTVRGSDFNRTFETPAKLDIPVDTSNRAAILFVSCDAAGKRIEANDIPGPETRIVTARFGGSGLFGDKALLFGPSGNIVQYFVRNTKEGVIRVGRGSEP